MNLFFILFTTSVMLVDKLVILIELSLHIKKQKKHKLEYKLVIHNYKKKNIENNLRKNRKAMKNICVLDDFIEKKLEKNSKIMKFLLFFMVLYFIYESYFNKNLVKLRFGILVGLACLLVLYNILIIYRYEKGYYGTNYEEAKELLYYIKKTKNNHNDSNGKKIFNETADKEIESEDLWEFLKE